LSVAFTKFKPLLITMNAIERALLYSVPVCLLVAAVAAIATGWHDASHITLSQFTQSKALSVTAVVVALLTLRRRDVLPVLSIGVVFEAARLLFFCGWRQLPIISVLPHAGMGLWYGSLIVSGVQVLASRGQERLAALDLGAIRLLFPCLGVLAGFVLERTIPNVQSTYDNYFYAFDGLLPFPYAKATAELFSQHNWIRETFLLVYKSLFVAAMCFVMLEGQSDGRPSGRLISRWLVVAFLGGVLYFVLPGVGPVVAFYGRHPTTLPSPNDVPLSLMVHVDGVTNAMPSLHAAWAYLIVMAAWRMKPMAFIVATAFMVATLIATLGLREHYFIDLVVALPFTIAVHGLLSFANWRTAKWENAVVTGSAAILTICWFFALCDGIAMMRGAPWVASACVTATIVVSVWFFLWIEQLNRAALLLGEPVTSPRVLVYPDSARVRLGEFLLLATGTVILAMFVLFHSPVTAHS
jgi:hypothetical protein